MGDAQDSKSLASAWLSTLMTSPVIEGATRYLVEILERGELC